MEKRSRFDDFWDNIDQYNSPEMAKYFHEIAPLIFRELIHHFIQQDEISIGNGIHGPISWAIVHYDWYDSDKVLAFRLDNKGRYSLYFHYWDEEGLLKELDYFMNDEQLRATPEGLRLLMKQVLDTKTGILVRKNKLKTGKSQNYAIRQKQSFQYICLI